MNTLRATGRFVRSLVFILIVASLVVVALPKTGAAEPAYGTYRWPVHGPVLRSYQDLPSPYVSGHRGIDVAAAFGTPIASMGQGTVAFAGKIGGALFISIDHPDGVRTTYSWVSQADVRKGDVVQAGDVIGLSGLGHPTGEIPEAHLHVGARIGDDYIDPMSLLEGLDVVGLIRLAPLAA